MRYFDDLPATWLERAKMLEDILVQAATGGGNDDAAYNALRDTFMSDDALKVLLPPFVRQYRSLSAFWGWIKGAADTYAGRRALIAEALNPLMEYLEGRHRAPGDGVVSDTLELFDADGVHAVWSKALSRRAADPEGAITVARTLLETVCKRILEVREVPYSDKEDLPKLYSMAARTLNLAPDQHTEEPIKAILGGAMSVVNGIGTLRNRLSDSHGRGGRKPVKPAPRHAALAVNIAGAVALFLVETHLDGESR